MHSFLAVPSVSWERSKSKPLAFKEQGTFGEYRRGNTSEILEIKKKKTIKKFLEVYMNTVKSELLNVLMGLPPLARISLCTAFSRRCYFELLRRAGWQRRRCRRFLPAARPPGRPPRHPQNPRGPKAPPEKLREERRLSSPRSALAPRRSPNSC